MAVLGQRDTRMLIGSVISNTYEAVAHQRRSDYSGGDGVDADAVGAEEVGHAASDAKHAGYMNRSALGRDYFNIAGQKSYSW